MGSKTKESTDVTIQDSRTVLAPLKCQPAQIIDDALEISKIEGLPAEFAGGSFMTGFPPSVKFEKPGDFAGGEFIHLRTDVGPNHSRVYRADEEVVAAESAAAANAAERAAVGNGKQGG